MFITDISEEFELAIVVHRLGNDWRNILNEQMSASARRGIIKISPKSGPKSLENAIWFDNEYYMLVGYNEGSMSFYIRSDTPGWERVYTNLTPQGIINSHLPLVRHNAITGEYFIVSHIE